MADISLLPDNLDAGVAYLVAVIAINKKGASPAVYNTVETLQRPELQLIEEKIPHEAEVRSCLSIYLHIYLISTYLPAGGGGGAGAGGGGGGGCLHHAPRGGRGRRETLQLWPQQRCRQTNNCNVRL